MASTKTEKPATAETVNGLRGPARANAKAHHAAILIEISPLGKGAQRYRVLRDDGTLLLKSTREPFFASARALIDAGAEPDTILEMRRRSSGNVALRGRLRTMAQLTVEETRNSGPRIRPWKRPPREGVGVTASTKSSPWDSPKHAIGDAHRLEPPRGGGHDGQDG